MALLTCGVAAGCLGFDYEFDVSNTSPDSYLIRVPIGSPKPGKYFVVSVDPGATGPALGWYGLIDAPIEVITTDCQVLSTFQRMPDGTYAAPGIAGLTGTVGGYAANRHWNNSAMHLRYICGGTALN